ncbi:MAG: twin transmembrane helix small protein [Betaproteobacteria bacterium]
MVKMLVVVMLLAIVGSLFSGLFFLYRDRGEGTRTARALSIRIGLSLILFIALLLSYRFGLVPGYSQ